MSTAQPGLLLPAAGPYSSRPRVYCFAHAGGNPRAFLDWQRHLGDAATLVAVCVPGRGHLAGRSAPASFEQFADEAAEAIAADLDGPAVLFGHSFGAVTAFEVARRLRNPEVQHLLASGCNAPRLLPTARVVRTAALKGREFADAVGFFGGLPPEALASDDLLELLLPGIMADFRTVAGYRYRPAEPLSCAVTLLNGRNDPHVDSAGLADWSLECRGEPDVRWVDGGHFYFDADPAAVVDVLRECAAPAAASAAGAHQHVEMI